MDTLQALYEFFHSQFFVTPPKPTKSWRGKTIIVTGGNAGLGFEAVKHIAALNPGKLIIACRSVAKGEEARRQLTRLVPSCPAEAIEVRQLDLGSYDSVKAFAAKVSSELPRLDSVIEGAGIHGGPEFKMLEQDEQALTTNVVSTFLLAVLLLPKLKETARTHGVQPTLSVISSETSQIANFPEQRLPQGQIFPALNDPRATNISERYQVTKLMQIMVVRALAKRLGPAETTPVIVTSANPGLNVTNMTGAGQQTLLGRVGLQMLRLIAREPDVGSRTYVLAAEAGPEVHGRYMSNGVVARMAPAALGVEGDKVCEKIWAELAEKLERIAPGATANI